MSHSLLRMLLLGLGLAVAVNGCQRRPAFPFAPVKGTVTKGGQPLANVRVTFYGDPDVDTQGPQTSGITDKDGRYRLHGDLLWSERGPAQEGAVVGKHRVCITDPQANSEAPEEKQRVPSRYSSITDTPLRVEVHPGPQTLNFDIP